MKNIFLLILSSLIVFSQWVQMRKGGSPATSGAPVIYWVSNPLPSRHETIREFHDWLKARGLPDIEVRLDTANAGLQKTIMQGVTGTAADVLSVSPGSLGYLATMGILGEVTNRPGDHDLDFEALYPPLREECRSAGKTYGVPKGFGMLFYFANLDLFERLGMPPPPVRWTFDEFERVGVEFDRRANPGKRRTIFFANTADHRELRRSLGISPYNETLTACAFDRPEYAALLRRIRRWTDDLHLTPTEAERASVVVDQGWGEAIWQVFSRGECGVMYTGRHALVTMRQMKNQPRMSGCEAPHGGWPVSTVQGVIFSPYRGTQKPEAVRQFLRFTFGEAYNLRIIREAEGCPPVARYLAHPEFIHPTGHTNEWRAHEVFKGMLDTIGMGPEYSPYHFAWSLSRIENNQASAYMSGIATAEETVKNMEADVNREIQGRVARTPALAQPFREACARQQKIDAVKRAGKKIPLALVDNPFLKRYYREKGFGE